MPMSVFSAVTIRLGFPSHERVVDELNREARKFDLRSIAVGLRQTNPLCVSADGRSAGPIGSTGPARGQAHRVGRRGEDRAGEPDLGASALRGISRPTLGQRLL